MEVTDQEVVAEQGLTKIRNLKLLCDETGKSLKECYDAMEYAGWELPRARDYLKYGW